VQIGCSSYYHYSEQCLQYLASTPGLAFDKSLSLKPYTKRRSNAPQRPGQSGSIATDELLIESSEHPAIDYVGREEEAGGTDRLLKHYIGVYDPATGGLQVIESRKMTVRGIVRAQNAAPEAFAEKGDYKVCYFSILHNMQILTKSRI
jgi:DNA-directed RNA polymerase I subunit RPA49